MCMMALLPLACKGRVCGGTLVSTWWVPFASRWSSCGHESVSGCSIVALAGQFPHQSWISLVSLITVAVVLRSLCMTHVTAAWAVAVVLPPTLVGRKGAPADYACNTVVTRRMPAEVAGREEPCCLTSLTVDVAAYVFTCLAGIVFVL